MQEEREDSFVVAAENYYDVIVIGAGFAGLFAAQQICKTQPTAKVALIDPKGILSPTSSSQNECFKMHTGLHYIKDRETAKECLRNTVEMADTFCNYIQDIENPAAPSRRGRHYLMNNTDSPTEAYVKAECEHLKNLEKSFRDAKEVAEAASRAKAEFLASMSHDVKTPLSGIVALSELLSKQPNASIKQKGEDIYQCGKQLISFFDNCIELSKMDMAQLQDVSQSFSMAKIIESIHVLFIPSAIAKKLAFTVHQDEQLPAVLIGNQINIYRVMLNLVGNAIKFTQAGSVHVSILFGRCVDDNNITVKIIVQDTGMGIPKDKQKVIFEKLQRLTPSYCNKQEGHGIGLYIVDQYVQAMQGSIEVDSTVGVGSKFTVTIPLKIASPDEMNVFILPKLSHQEVSEAQVTQSVMRTTTTLQSQELKEKAPRILLVEDNLLIQVAMKEILQSTGAYVDVAGNGQEALTLFKPDKYALIYMDIGLSDMSGYEVSKCIRAIEAGAAAARVPIIALTAHTDIDVKLSCADAGMEGMMSKPLSFQQAEQVLEHYALKRPILVEGLQIL